MLDERPDNGRIAQLGERFPYKEEVTGSSPVSPTKFGDKDGVWNTRIGSIR